MHGDDPAQSSPRLLAAIGRRVALSELEHANRTEGQHHGHAGKDERRAQEREHIARGEAAGAREGCGAQVQGTGVDGLGQNVAQRPEGDRSDGGDADDAAEKADRDGRGEGFQELLTTFESDEHVLTAVEAGAAGFPVKNIPPDQLIAAIRIMHSGDAVISPGPTRRLLATFRRRPAESRTPSRGSDTQAVAELTPREREILSLIAEGRTNQEICTELWLSMPTIKTHIGNLIAKTGSRDRVQLVLFALRTGIAALKAR
ncbi:LuxR C-terminal-related transcriptional regulator [Polymorphospora lycopeni]|uniref:Response regulator transcription factor n=1 Tax=Polymorphospora lycopeni TaxID=3140240 RepID=A0ABV5CR23_9ACTN